MLRFDDQFPIHRKLAGLNDSAFRFYVEALFWCARHLTDGWIAQGEIGVVSRYRKPLDLVQMCVERETWHRVQDGRFAVRCQECEDRYGNTLTGDGWIIHGYLDWQQTRSKVLQIREARRKAGKLGGQRSASVRASRKSGDEPAGQAGRGSKNKANAEAKPAPVAQPPIPSPSSKGIGDARAAPLGAPRVPEPPDSHPPPSNGRPAAKPPDLSQTRAVLAAAQRKLRTSGNRREGAALDRLRELTPDAPIPDPPDDLPAADEGAHPR